MSFEQLRFLVPSLYDVIQILIVAIVVYRLLLFLAGTRALQILLGITALGVIYIGALVLRLNMITTLLGLVFTYGAFAVIVVFQPELRHALARLGRSRVISFLASSSKRAVADEIAEAVARLARNGTGAIIAVERDVSLDHYLEAGTVMRATVSADLLTTIFTPYSPLHDGAAIIRGDQIVGAGSVLPLTQFPVRDRSLGTRHRAALGLSEETDAVVIVVSEETSKISVALRGMLRRGVTPDQVREALVGGEEAGLALAGARSDASPA
ncbi:MAG: TIGR00159 family protein [Gemmatimonadales bacterium]|nr:TIGR00159 family protein [Gemmatimonadales bacterium]NIN11340.1 TIGR00159 family protein [Gemmatimonadales bacterium]NIN49950.1 TIGR00159 family protein [Gemmatimonadales bacterium]NIP07414.1 TIGR00159 family protein [Gemmatimonadales bacterium]NIR00481.1 TIGR00159 family protein [Gemmatimonadales bacterium]